MLLKFLIFIFIFLLLSFQYMIFIYLFIVHMSTAVEVKLVSYIEEKYGDDDDE